MKRWLVWIVALVVLGVLVLVPALTYSLAKDSSGGDDVARIDDYRADFTVGEDGDLRVVETLRVFYPIYKHGIFRFFDVVDPNDSSVRLIPRDIAVTRDGTQEPFETLSEGHGRYRNIKIGSASVTMDGSHTYVIRYRIPDVLAPQDGPRGGGSQFYWNLIPSGWQMPIQQSELVVNLPAEAGEVECAVGVDAQDGCDAAGVGTRTLTVKTAALPAHTPVTLQTDLDLPAPARAHRPWSAAYDAVLGPDRGVLGVVLLLAAGAGLLGWRIARQTREEQPGYPLMYAPPDGVGPAEAVYVYSEKVPRESFVASIMQTAVKGATTLTHGSGWTITDAGQPAAWESLDPVSAYAAQSLGVPGGSFKASSSATAGKKLKTALSQFDGATRSWARENGLVVTAGMGTLASLLVLGAGVLAGSLAVFNPFDLSVLALVPGLFAVFGLETLRPGSSTRRTPAGRELWSRVGGFRRVLATDSAEARFDFSGKKELYTAYVPWAVAFGVADVWAKKYRLETGEEPPAPSYLYGAGGGVLGGDIGSSMADDFSDTVDSAISAYQATQSSSSGSGGGGGGFSGGGGGGGGGGGSW